jgi:hypothetical protein
MCFSQFFNKIFKRRKRDLKNKYIMPINKCYLCTFYQRTDNDYLYTFEDMLLCSKCYVKKYNESKNTWFVTSSC